MAKRATDDPADAPTTGTIEDFAEDLGRFIGSVQAKAEGWLAQRRQVSETLISIRDEATRLLRELGHEAKQARTRAKTQSIAERSTRAWREPQTAVRKRGPGQRGWSASQRAAAAERMRKYWATRKKK